MDEQEREDDMKLLWGAFSRDDEGTTIYDATRKPVDPMPLILTSMDAPWSMRRAEMRAELLRQLRSGRKRVKNLLDRIDKDIAEVEFICRTKGETP
jgi:hypothetical protein